jgi:UDP-N-acetyl-alpha-D-muramoyl-L-alanyl-L-glutamate epimerase
MIRSEELRLKYPVFRYEHFEFARDASRFVVRFNYSIPPDISFSPEVHFEPVRDGWNDIPDDLLHNAVFHLGLIESFSYWKATASPVIEVHAGTLTPEQVSWWEDLLINGMGEYFYRNNIDFTSGGFVAIVPASGGRSYAPYKASLSARSLLTIGGGRDSALAAGLLRNSGQAFACMMLNPSSAATAIARHVSNADPIVIRRTICPELLELNRRGYLNGHTPFSAYLAFLGAACLVAYGYSNIIVANERSSDEGNVHYLGRDINHQYSKSFAFETQFDEYLRKYVAGNGRYFSLVRPLYELQIGKLFSGFPDFFDLFKSCNRNRSDSWCGQCPKCVSVFLTMYPFVPAATLTKIFGRDLFNSEETIPILRELAGFEIKPFECVATTDEVVAALALAIQKLQNDSQPLPPVLEYAVRNIPGVNNPQTGAALLASYGRHRIPQEFESFLTKALKESPRSL